MRGTRLLVATAAAAALIVGAASVGGNASASGDAENAGQGFVKQFGALLTGAAEVPGPGDADGSGFAVVKVNLPGGRICVLGFDTHQIADPTLFHIHQGTADVAGPVVVDFTPFLPDGTGCVRVAPKLARAIVQDPAGYYFNVHNADFPAGAVRGTLTAL